MNDIRHTQNFIHSASLANKLVDRAAIKAGSTVLEIGPGKGIFTRPLAKRVTAKGQVVAVEYDKALVDTLTTDFESLPQVSIEYGDILQFDLSRLRDDYVVFSNVPFNITSQVLELLFTGENPPSRAYLILQTDTLVGKGYKDGPPTETFKSMMIKPAYEIGTIYHFSRNDFKPRPQVDTVLFSFVRRDKPLIDTDHYALYKDFLAFIAKDRAGEGAWKKVFSKRQIDKLDVVMNRGLKSQSVESIAGAFAFLSTLSKAHIVQGAMERLREEQAKMEAKNVSGKHRRGKQGKKNKPQRR